jgi:hypothetical protein
MSLKTLTVVVCVAGFKHFENCSYVLSYAETITHLTPQGPGRPGPGEGPVGHVCRDLASNIVVFIGLFQTHWKLTQGLFVKLVQSSLFQMVTIS